MHVITSHVKMEALVLHMKMHMCVHVHQVIVEQTVNYVRKNICQISNNVCTSRPCRNGGTCIALGSQYLCLCKAGYSGSNCQSCMYIQII